MYLSSMFSFMKPVFHSGQLETLHGVLLEMVPQWSERLCVAKHEDDERRLVARTDRLVDCIAPIARQKSVAHAVFTGAYPGLVLFATSCQKTWPPVFNDVTIQVNNLDIVEGKPADVWMKDVFEAIVERLDIHYARACDERDFASKNLLEVNGGARAIGVDFEKAIPGLYWLNYFGAGYVDFLGRDRLLTSPAVEVKAVRDGVLLELYRSPADWQSDVAGKCVEAVTAHLGRQFFFSRYEPDRQTIAPDFA